jgi:NADH-quinone oxidoreductase subunit A
MDQYLPIFLMLVLAILFSGLSFFASGLLAPKKASAAKEAPYECGIVPTREPAERFPVRFYVVAMLFIIFDIEIIFLYPWAVTFGELGTYGLVAMIVFAAVVFISLLYEIAMGGLEWGAHGRVMAVAEGDEAAPVRTSSSSIRRVPSNVSPPVPSTTPEPTGAVA